MADLMQVLIVERDGTRVAPLDADVSEVAWKLNDAADVTVRFDPEDPGAALLSLGGEHEVQVWDDEGLLWWGVPAGVPTVGPSGDVDMSCQTLEAHFGSRLVVRNLRYDGVDQLAIGARLVEHAQSNTVQSGDAGLNIHVAAFAASGVARDRSYHADERPGILHVLQLLSGVRQGFDWEVTPFADGRREWTPHWPTRGPVIDHLQWDPSGSRGIVSFSGQIDALTVNEAHVSGDAGDAGTRTPFGIFRDTTARAKHGLRQHVESASEGTVDQRTLNDRARRIVEDRKEPKVTLGLTVEATDVFAPRDVRPGDRFHVSVRRGFFSFSGVVKVTAATYRLSDETAVLEVEAWQ